MLTGRDQRLRRGPHRAHRHPRGVLAEPHLPPGPPADVGKVDAAACVSLRFSREHAIWHAIGSDCQGPEATGVVMIILGIIILIIGFLLKIAILWTIGIIILVIGLILMLLGALGHAVGGRRHYW
jgi:hypothetical protein